MTIVRRSRPVPITTALRLLWKIGVIAVAVATAILAVPSGIVAFWVTPFAIIGAVLAIRRPGVSIGWILLGMAWSFVLGSTVGIDPDQIDRGVLSWSAMPLAALIHIGPSVGFALLALLALTFPSGRLPKDRWSRPARIVLGGNLVLIAASVFEPILELPVSGSSAYASVRNPLSVLPTLPIWRLMDTDSAVDQALGLLLLAVSVVAVADRWRRARGIERQQLRWFGAALVFLVLAVAGGAVLTAIDPSLWDSGYVWYPAIAAFPIVPLAIGVAVLRYRLYDIDTIINRAIVYTLLTAVLAGASAAMIGLGQRLFEGVVGRGSDATIVLTTLLIVTAFTPIKNRLQAIVDRRFKEVRDPVADLEAFIAEVRGALTDPTIHRASRRLLDVAVLGYGATSGEVRAATGPDPIVVSTGPDPAGEAVLASSADGAIELRLWGVDASRDLRDLTALRAALDVVRGEVAAPRRTPRRPLERPAGDT